MKENMKQELLEEMKKGKIYGHICTNGYHYDKDDLIRIIKELDCTMSTYVTKGEYQNIMDSVTEQLEEYL